MNEGRARRVGRNESLYRLVNEQIEGINETFGVLTGDFAVVCECEDLHCQEQITVTRAAYEQVRENSAAFIIKPGHQAEDEEDVVEETAGYFVVVKKPGMPARLASETDPRS
jgi:hypothetical protein